MTHDAPNADGELHGLTARLRQAVASCIAVARAARSIASLDLTGTDSPWEWPTALGPAPAAAPGVPFTATAAARLHEMAEANGRELEQLAGLMAEAPAPQDRQLRVVWADVRALCKDWVGRNAVTVEVLAGMADRLAGQGPTSG